jgi:hypothetical protein
MSFGRNQSKADSHGTRPSSGRPEVLVIGAGPAGLAVSACLRASNVAFELIDAYGQAGGAYQRMCPNIILSSPASYLSLPRLPIDAGKPNVTVAEFADYLARYAKSYELEPVQTRVTSVTARNGAFLVKFDKRPAHTYRAVVAASGMCEHPNYPQIPGLVCPGHSTPSAPKAIHAHDWSGTGGSHRRILIIGRGMRAVEIAEECAAAGIATVISARQRKVRTWRRTIWGTDVRKVLFPATRFLSALLQRWFPSYCAQPFTFPGIDRGFAGYRSVGLIDVQGSVVRFEGRTAVLTMEHAANSTSSLPRPATVTQCRSSPTTLPVLRRAICYLAMGNPFHGRACTSSAFPVHAGSQASSSTASSTTRQPLQQASGDCSPQLGSLAWQPIRYVEAVGFDLVGRQGKPSALHHALTPFGL